MNKKIILIGIILSIIFLWFIISKIKEEDSYSEEIYFLQIGVYKNHSNLAKITKLLDNYLVKKDGDLYFVYVGITSSKDNANKIKEFYSEKGNNIYIKTIKESNKIFLNDLKKYDELLKNTININTQKSINNEILKRYKEVLNGENI